MPTQITQHFDFAQVSTLPRRDLLSAGVLTQAGFGQEKTHILNG